VHISDGILSWPWLVGGWAGAILLLALTCRRVSDEMIPKLGTMTAAFFAGSQLHVKLAGLTTVHLLMNGAIGVRLGRLAVPAIFVGLAFQLLFFAHGGWTTLGMNVVIYSLPSLAAGLAASGLRRRGYRLPKVIRSVAVLTGTCACVAAAGWAIERTWAWDWGLEIWIAIAAGIGIVSTLLEILLLHEPVFACGFWIGGLTALATVALNVAVIAFGASQATANLAGLIFAAHIPIIVVEALLTGTMLAFIVAVAPQRTDVTSEISSNGTSH